MTESLNLSKLPSSVSTRIAGCMSVSHINNLCPDFSATMARVRSTASKFVCMTSSATWVLQKLLPLCHQEKTQPAMLILTPRYPCLGSSLLACSELFTLQSVVPGHHAELRPKHTIKRHREAKIHVRTLPAVRCRASVTCRLRQTTPLFHCPSYQRCSGLGSQPPASA